jgi:2-polyprenyl-6-methoxyphenol hydroxylase-like FAD-dependent oxidoreductase
MAAVGPGPQPTDQPPPELSAVDCRLSTPSAIELGFDAVEYSQDADRVRLKSRDGREREGSLLVGADGLRSAVREQMVRDGAPKYAGYTSWRGVTPPCDLAEPGRVVESWGRGQRFGIVPIAGRRVYWFATANAPAGERDPGKAALLDRFREFHAPVSALIEATDEEALLRADIYDRDPIDRWTEGRVVLLGDAAHPMAPNLGQGGCQAMEDALALARALAKQIDHRAAFAEYERERIGRANDFVRWSRSFGRAGQLESAPARWLRDLALRATPKGMMERSMRKTFEFDASGLTPS